MRRSGDELEEVLEEIKRVLLPHKGEFFMPSADQVLQHGGSQTSLVGDLGDDVGVGFGVPTR